MQRYEETTQMDMNIRAEYKKVMEQVVRALKSAEQVWLMKATRGGQDEGTKVTIDNKIGKEKSQKASQEWNN